MSKIIELNLTNLKVNSNLVVYLLEGFIGNNDLTESDLSSLKAILSDLRETISIVEFYLFIAPYDNEIMTMINK